ncbi:MAG TPA: T9SS type A sorting domain-containing protein, partial [Rhodothermia bacterium]|nr:T9SS type A sorting domain-containing protein [Rhodothermia bacterium]
VWHSTNPNLVLGASQFNAIQKSTDGGSFFGPATTGLTDVGSGTGGQFVTRIAKSRIDPDLVFTVGTSGVWRSDDFADNWTLSPVDINEWNASNITDVTVSEANAQIVWAGARASSVGKVHVSTDGGLTFSPVSILTNNFGLIGSIDTHPTEEGTAYALFSLAGLPKIVRTTDYGVTWEDITGFVSGGGVSDNGFPDVAVYSVVVLPHNPNEIWAGTEIGLFISEDNGETWAFADDGLPSVAIWEMKIVGDEVVAATHGRGIWSVEIPELLTAELPDIPVAPRLNNAFFSPVGALAMDLDLRAAFDSVQIRANGQPVGASGPTVPGDTTIQVPFNTAGSFTIQAVGYKDGKTFFSPSANVATTEVPPKQWSYENEFTSLSSGRDFAAAGFAVNRIEGWLATTSPYPILTELTATLSFPIVVSDVISTLKWTDVALVQPGLPGFDYTQPGFRDYVIVEATRDGVEWLPLIDGYDARFDARWLTLYGSGQAPAQELLVEHEVDLRDTFSAGEIIFIRFRLHSDDNGTGWGWAIGKIEVQPGAPIANESETELPAEFALHGNYPNPFNPSTNISFSLPQRSDVTVRIYDLNGRLVETLVQSDFDAGTHSVRWDASSVASGTYLYRLVAGDYVASRKMLLVR